VQNCWQSYISVVVDIRAVRRELIRSGGFRIPGQLFIRMTMATRE